MESLKKKDLDFKSVNAFLKLAKTNNKIKDSKLKNSKVTIWNIGT